MQSIARIVNVLENTLERPKTMPFLRMAFAKMTSTMSNATMMASIAAHPTVIRNIALSVNAKVLLTTKSFESQFPDFILKFKNLKKQNFDNASL